jgi:hypothetical protein
MCAGRDIQERGKLGLCQAEPLAVSFELFGEGHTVWRRQTTE